MIDPSNNIVNAAIILSKQLGIKITSSILKKSLEQNPYYPSLLSLSSVFNRFNVPNQCFELTFEQFQELEAPFIAFWNREFLAVTDRTDDSITYTDSNGKSITASVQAFAKYSKVVFVAEPNQNSGDPEYHLNSKKDKAHNIRRGQMLFLTALTGILALLQFYVFNVQSLDSPALAQAALLFTAKITGLFGTILLLMYELDKNNALLKNICSIGKQVNCDAILSGKLSRVYGITWTEIGLIYFSSTTLFLFYPGIPFELKKPFLMFSSLIASFYILFSLYYQWRVIKAWCPLCLIVQASLTLDLIWAIWSLNTSNANHAYLVTDPQVTVALLLVLLLSVIAMFFAKPILSNAKKVNEFEALYKRLLYNRDIFNSMLLREQNAPQGWSTIGLTLGNPNAKNTIIKVCNPYCGPCAKLHPVLEEIILSDTNFNVKVIFTSTNEIKDRGGLVARHLLAIADQGNMTQTRKAMEDWYQAESKDYQTFATKYPMNGEIEKQRDKLEKMRMWCKEAGITYTPTLFINGKRLPDTYDVEELRHILQ